MLVVRGFRCLAQGHQWVWMWERTAQALTQIPTSLVPVGDRTSDPPVTSASAQPVAMNAPRLKTGICIMMLDLASVR